MGKGNFFRKVFHKPGRAIEQVIHTPVKVLKEVSRASDKVGKELARGWQGGSGDHAGDGKEIDDKRGQSLRWGLIVGGEGLDEQFEMITNNPDMFVIFFQEIISF